MNRVRCWIVGLTGLMAVVADSAAAPATVYTNDFQSAKAGALEESAEVIILAGKFDVKEAGDNLVLELPGAPLDTFAVLLGPSLSPKASTMQSVGARIRGVAKGRRYPAFGVGLCGVGGYRLQLTPAKRALELYDGDQLVVSARQRWESGAWTRFRLQLIRGGEQWRVNGKAWPATAAEPAEWGVSYVPKEEPIPGQASIWGIPYSGEPIQFDDLAVSAEKESLSSTPE